MTPAKGQSRGLSSEVTEGGLIDTCELWGSMLWRDGAASLVSHDDKGPCLQTGGDQTSLPLKARLDSRS